MANSTKKPRKPAPTKDYSVITQLISNDDLLKLKKLAKAKGFDTVQALVRYILRDFVVKNPA